MTLWSTMTVPTVLQMKPIKGPLQHKPLLNNAGSTDFLPVSGGNKRPEKISSPSTQN